MPKSNGALLEPCTFTAQKNSLFSLSFKVCDRSIWFLGHFPSIKQCGGVLYLIFALAKVKFFLWCYEGGNVFDKNQEKSAYIDSLWNNTGQNRAKIKCDNYTRIQYNKINKQKKKKQQIRLWYTQTIGQDRIRLILINTFLFFTKY